MQKLDICCAHCLDTAPSVLTGHKALAPCSRDMELVAAENRWSLLQLQQAARFQFQGSSGIADSSLVSHHVLFLHQFLAWATSFWFLGRDCCPKIHRLTLHGLSNYPFSMALPLSLADGNDTQLPTAISTKLNSATEYLHAIAPCWPVNSLTGKVDKDAETRNGWIGETEPNTEEPRPRVSAKRPLE